MGLARLAAAQTDVELARTQKRPDWSVELDYAQRGPTFSNVVTLEFRIGLPLFAKNKCAELRDAMRWLRGYGGARSLDEIRCPVLLAFPEKDFVLPRKRYGERLVTSIAHAEVVDLPGVGHAAMVDDPELVARTILGFTRRHASVSWEPVAV